MNLEALNEIYKPEVRRALSSYTRHLDDVRINLKQREEQAKRQLREYERSGKAMEEVAEKFAALKSEASAVKLDIKRLGDEV